MSNRQFNWDRLFRADWHIDDLRLKNITGRSSSGVSRRDFIKLSSLVSSAIFTGLPGAFASRIEVKGDERRLAVTVDGEERWVVDPVFFAGKPQLAIKNRSPRGFAFSLRSARFPGTRFFADFNCQMKDDGTLAIHFTREDLKFSVNADSWLTGQSTGRSEWSGLINLACASEQIGPTQIRPRTVQFTPDWGFRFDCGQKHSFSFLGTGLKSKVFELSLPDTAPSLLTSPPRRRSLLWVERGANEWPLLLGDWTQPLNLEGGGNNPYAALAVELGENAQGHFRTIALAESSSPITCHLKREQSTGGPFALPLGRTRIAVYRDRQGETRLFAGHLAEEQVFLDRSLFKAILTGNSGRPAVFALADENSSSYSIRPALAHIEVPMGGAETQTTRLSENAHLAINVGGGASLDAADSPSQFGTNTFGTNVVIDNEDLTQTILGPGNLVHAAGRIPLDRDDTKLYSPKAAPDWYVVNIFPGMLTEALGSMNEADATLTLTLNGAQMDVIRPADFLKLTFEFRGMQLRMRELDPVLEPAADVDQALLIVHLPAQTIGEQVFDTDQLPDSTRAQSLLGGESQLVFRPFTGCGLASEDIVDLEGLRVDLAAMKSEAAKWVLARLSSPVQQLVTGIGNDADVHLLRPLILRDLNQLLRRSAQSDIDDPPPKVETPQLPAQKQKPPAIELMLQRRNYLRAAFPGRFSGMKPEPIRYTLDRLLEWDSFELVVPENAKNDGQRVAPGPINEPGGSDPRTAIEIPFRLLLSPSPAAAWRQTPRPTITGGVDVELWRAQVVDNAIRAVYSRDYPKDHNPIFPGCSSATPADNGPFTTSMSRFDRYQIVRLCSDFRINVDGWHPSPLGVNEMALSALGGWLDCDTNWSLRHDVPFPGGASKPFDVTRWRHIATMGRDQYCRIEYKGYLLPLGHRAVLVKETKRVFANTSRGGYRCYLEQRWFVDVRQQIRTYPGVVNGGDLEQNDSRGFPFSEVKFITLSSPPANNHPASVCPDEPEVSPADLFIPDANGNPFRFIVSCKDGSPNPDTVTFDLPLIFVKESDARPYNGATLMRITTTYNRLADLPSPAPDMRIADLHGQKLHYMPPLQPGDTELETLAMSFEVQAVAITDMLLLQHNDLPSFAPAMSRAVVRIPSVALMAPGAPTAVITLNDDYVQGTKNPDGTVKNVGEIFANVIGGTTPFAFPPAHGGGLATPSVNVAALSRKLGPVGGTSSSSVTIGKFDPRQFFDDAPKLFGIVNFRDLLGSVVTGFGTAPKMLVQQVQGAAGEAKKIVDRVQALESQMQGQLDDARAALDGYIVAINSAAQGSLNRILGEINGYPGVSANAVFILGPTSVVLQANAKLDLKAAENSLLQYLARKYPDAAAVVQNPTLILDSVPLPEDVGPKALRQKVAAYCALQSNISLTDARYLTVLLDPSRKLDGVAESLVQTVAKIGPLYQTAVDVLAEIPPRELLAAVNNMSAAFDQLKNGNIGTFVGSAGNLLNTIIKTLDSVGEITSSKELEALKVAVDTARKNINDQYTAITNQVERIKRTIHRKAVERLQEIYGDTVPQEIAGYFDISNAESQLNQIFQQLVSSVLNPAAELANGLAQFLADLNSAATRLEQEIDAVVAAKNAIFQEIQDIQRILLQPIALQLDYTYTTPLYDGPSGLPVFRAGLNGKAASMTMDIRIHQGLDSSDRSESIDVAVSNFQIVLLPSTQFLIVKFNQVRFTAKNGGKADIGVDIAGVELGDCLNFVKSLQSCIPALGNQGNGPFIDIDGPDIQAGYRFGRDKLTLGGFNIYNLAIEASVDISLDGHPVEVRFAFCSRERPFLLTSGIFGGGGFFAIELDSTEVTSLEAAIEFGAVAGISVGVASGMASLTGGIYFSKHPRSVVLTGFFCAAGNLDIAGIIHLSMVFYMGLTYQQVGDQSCAYGEVTVHVEISIAFFSISYDLHATRTISGSSAGSAATASTTDPDLSHLALLDSLELLTQRSALHGITAEHWQEYRDAFELV